MKRAHTTRHRRGATLMFVLVILVLAVTLAGRRMLENTTGRLAAAGTSFRTESLWIAQGVASQWAEASTVSTMSTDALLAPTRWSLGRYQIQISPSSCQDKIHVMSVPVQDWLFFYQRHCQVLLVEDPEKILIQRGSGAIEMLLNDHYLSGQAAYISNSGQRVPADLLTVWGSGKVDLNHCSPEILAARLHGFTDAQVSGIVRLRTEAPIVQLARLTNALGLSEHQKAQLEQAATLKPEMLALVIRIEKGALSCVYHAVIDVSGQPRVVEVRLVE